MTIPSDACSEEFLNHANGNAEERETKLILAMHFVLFIETKSFLKVDQGQFEKFLYSFS